MQFVLFRAVPYLSFAWTHDWPMNAPTGHEEPSPGQTEPKAECHPGFTDLPHYRALTGQVETLGIIARDKDKIP